MEMDNFVFVKYLSKALTCGGGDPLAAHFIEANCPGRTICSSNVDIISGTTSKKTISD